MKRGRCQAATGLVELLEHVDAGKAPRIPDISRRSRVAVPAPVAPGSTWPGPGGGGAATGVQRRGLSGGRPDLLDHGWPGTLGLHRCWRLWIRSPAHTPCATPRWSMSAWLPNVRTENSGRPDPESLAAGHPPPYRGTAGRAMDLTPLWTMWTVAARCAAAPPAHNAHSGLDTAARCPQAHSPGDGLRIRVSGFRARRPAASGARCRRFPEGACGAMTGRRARCGCRARGCDRG